MEAPLGLVESYVRAPTMICLQTLVSPYHQPVSRVPDALGDLDLDSLLPFLKHTPLFALPILCLCSCPVFCPEECLSSPLSTWRTPPQSSRPAQGSEQESEDTNSNPGLAFKILISKLRESDQIIML